MSDLLVGFTVGVVFGGIALYIWTLYSRSTWFKLANKLLDDKFNELKASITADNDAKKARANLVRDFMEPLNEPVNCFQHAQTDYFS